MEKETRGSGRQYIFIITRPNVELNDLEEMIGSLEEMGIWIDRGYGVVPVDPRESRFALRGRAHEDVIKRVKNDSAIEVFPDLEVGKA